MDAPLAAIEHSELATTLRFSRWGYAAVNAAHVLGVALLVGSIIPLDLRLLGLWPRTPRDALIRVLVPVAILGLLLAVAAGSLLFAVRSTEYAALPIFQIKLALIVAGASSALLLHLRHGFLLETASRPRLVVAGALSMICWLGALIAGRTIAFVGNT